MRHSQSMRLHGMPGSIVIQTHIILYIVYIYVHQTKQNKTKPDQTKQFRIGFASDDGSADLKICEKILFCVYVCVFFSVW